MTKNDLKEIEAYVLQNFEAFVSKNLAPILTGLIKLGHKPNQLIAELNKQNTLATITPNSSHKLLEAAIEA